MVWIVIVTLSTLVWVLAKFYLSGPELTGYDKPVGLRFKSHPDDAKVNDLVFTEFQKVHDAVDAVNSPLTALGIIRSVADDFSLDLETDTKFISVDANGVDCEWALAPQSNPKRRILFMHGGAFLFGSAKGHRKYCDQLAKISNASVLSVNYRLLPKFGRNAGITDTQKAYRWILENGPDDKTEPELLIVAGDSAGGNLAMMISSWSKNNAAHKPDAVISFSPFLDMTMNAPTFLRNMATDKILGEGLLGKGFGFLAKTPLLLRSWVMLLIMRMSPSNPLASPLFGNLSGLPKTLIQASSNEMLLGDSIRYTNKAIEAGSDVKLQIWEDQMHDWHIFNMGVGSANQAWEEVSQFIDDISS